MSQPMFERDLLYPTDVPFEPGSVHIRVFAPESDGRMPVHVEAKTAHNPRNHLDEIVNIMQSDIFDRIRMDIRKPSREGRAPEGVMRERNQGDRVSFVKWRVATALRDFLRGALISLRAAITMLCDHDKFLTVLHP